jgi:hypothetical protein
MSVHWAGKRRPGAIGHSAVINKALSPVAQTFLLAVACTDVAIFRTEEQ